MELYRTSLFSKSSLIAYYRLEGNSTDEKVSYNGTGANNITYSINNGKFGQGAGFNGTDSYINFGNPIIPIGAKTIGCWVKTTTFDQGTLINNFRQSTTENGDLLTTRNDGCFEYAIQYATGSSKSIVDNQVIADGNWHLGIGTYDGTNSRLYVDGVLKQTSSSFTDSGARGQNLHLGIDPFFSFNPYNGGMDEVFIFNSVLNPSEIQQIYSNGAGGLLAFL